MEKEILVSIWCITYNHEPYIREAIEGFLAQKTDFRYEIIIHDDASTDKTAEIIKEYEHKYPQLIHGIYEAENQYRKNISDISWLMNIEQEYCRGKYIALCEGDDCWIDCHKLQIQADYMESHSDCALSLHNALQLNCQDGTMKAVDPFDGNKERNISSEEIIMQYKGHPPTASVFYKRELIEMPDFFHKTPVGDYPLLLYGFTKGKVYYDSRIMSVYRWLSAGSYNERLTLNKEMEFYFDMGLIAFLVQYDEFTDYKYHVWISNRIQQFASRAISAVDLKIPLKKYYEKCKKHGYYLAIECGDYLDRMEYLRKQIFDMAYCSERTRNFVRKFKNIIIMGKGNYGTIVARQFKKNEIEFCGFAVSHKMKGEGFFMGKPVWELAKLLFSKENTGVIVAINPLRWDDISESLNGAGIIHYTCPFLF